MKIAIIGAGMAGLACGQRLRAAGHEVTLFDKGRGPGGRMATRRADVDGTTLHFDHGAQYFTVSDDRFRAQVEQWRDAGVVAEWPEARLGAWVGTPGMNAPIRAMAAEQNVHFGARVEAIGKSGDGWGLDGAGVPGAVYDAVLVAVPAEQAEPLLAPYAPAMAQRAKATISAPCWTLMAAFEERLEHDDTLRNVGSVIWAARNGSKPQRGNEESWVVHASLGWSKAHLEVDADEAARLLLERFREAMGIEFPAIRHVSAHRWRFAQSGNAGEGAMWDGDQHIGACGDWLLGPRVECAYLSGLMLAEAVGDG